MLGAIKRRDLTFPGRNTFSSCQQHDMYKLKLQNRTDTQIKETVLVSLIRIISRIQEPNAFRRSSNAKLT
jgi:hypothetical protein